MGEGDLIFNRVLNTGSVWILLIQAVELLD